MGKGGGGAIYFEVRGAITLKGGNLLRSNLLLGDTSGGQVTS